MSYNDTYAHTPVRKMFELKDVYGVGYDEERAAKKKIKLGIIGAGGVAQSKHLPAINRLRTLWEPVQVTAFATRNLQQAEKLKAIYGGNWYNDYHTMIKEEPLDGVIVCSSDDVHYQHVLACLEKGLGVLVEKPVTRSLKQASEICKTADKMKSVFMTVANKRYSPPYYRAKKEILNGAIQNPAMICGKFNLGYNYVDILEGGTIHLFDITRYLMGDILTISSNTVKKYNFNQTGYPFDNGVCMLNFTSGAVGVLYTSATALSLKPWENVEVYGEKAWLAVEDQQKLIVYDSEEGPSKSFEPVFPNTLVFDEEFAGFMPMIQDFINCLRDGGTPLVTGWDGYKAYELVVAFHISAHTHQNLLLPLQAEEADMEVLKIFKSAQKK